MIKFKNIFIIIKIYLLVVILFSFFRFILFITETDKAGGLTENASDIVKAFIMGIRFDLVISGYILLLPYLAISVVLLFNLQNISIYHIVFWWMFILFSVSLLICAADIPYYNQFVSRFSVEAFQWFDKPGFVLKMIFQEPRYYWAIIPLVVFIFFLYRILRVLLKPLSVRDITKRSVVYIIVSVLFAGLIFLGIRGRIQKKSPIRIGTAYFSDNPFLNQLGLNPVFTFMRSYIDSRDIKNKTEVLINEDTAVTNVRKYLNIQKPFRDSPVARYIIPDSTSEIKYNVVLVIMESMSASKMKRHGNKKDLTPFLDSIANNSYYFENIYTSGKHTYCGVFSTLFSFPVIYGQQPLKENGIKKYNGISGTLKKLGYSTTYFTTHDGQFDNIEGFLRTNDFDNIITQSDYPSEEVQTTLGVPDDYMFEYAIPVIDRLYYAKTPFFVTLVTASDHGPYYVPGYFKPENNDIKDQIVEYADWSLKEFIKTASEKKWFDNTIFVFIADHGAPMILTYDIPLDYYHSPLIIYAPGVLKESKCFSCTGGQIDVFPTIMGLLRQSYLNNTLGIDLLKEKRPYIFINDEDKFGVLDSTYLLIVKNDNTTGLFRYRDGDKTDYKTSYPALAKEMGIYARSNLQVFQMMKQNKYSFLAK